ncbi:MAG TPA: peptide chain release factor N(5)-glutamine methyltransferase [Vicinamibacterales bacterium]|nr:peptide chain release factor N(5)-glutamine methyltransferase [Vicinamibacterales bacterium]
MTIDRPVPVTPRRLAATARERLIAAGIEPGEAAMDAELLTREVLGGWERARFLAHRDDPVEGVAGELEALLTRRERREPISQVLGRREFWGLEFEVTSAVLTPRPETELIVEEALAFLRRLVAGDGGAPRGGSGRHGSGGGRPCPPVLHVADVGTGSGCLAICLAREIPSALVFATDVSEPALAVARRNAQRHGVAGRIRFEAASLLGTAPRPFPLIVSNPPYVPTADLPTLPPEVRAFEPGTALDGGADGLAIIRALLDASRSALSNEGRLIFEFGVGQADGVRTAVLESGLELLAIRPDLQGIPRTAVAARRGPGA